MGATQCGGVHTKVKFKVTKRSKTTFLRSESNRRNLLKFGGMICHDPRNNQLVFWSDWVKGQGPGHYKVKNFFLRYLGQFVSDLHETSAKMCRIQFPIIWYATQCGGVIDIYIHWMEDVGQPGL